MQARSISGVATVLGYELHPLASGFVPLFSPRTAALLCIKALCEDAKIADENKDAFAFAHAAHGYKPSDGVLLRVRRIEHDVSHNAGLANIYALPPSCISSSTIPDVLLVDPCLASEIPLFRIHPQWTSIAEAFQSSWSDAEAQPPIVVVCGARKVGKSTFSRYLANCMLNSKEAVAFLDLDLGQTEFTPPGCASLDILKGPLLGPPFTHLRATDQCHFLGITSPSDDPDLYLASCRRLYQHFAHSHEARRIPMIVNTMGWITGLGFHLLQFVLQLIRPTHIVSFSDDPAVHPHAYDFIARALFGESVVDGMEKYTTARIPLVTYLEAACAGGSGQNSRTVYAPADLRALSISAYFGDAFLRVPYQMSFEHIQVCMLKNVKANMLLFRLNKAFVGLYNDPSFVPHLRDTLPKVTYMVPRGNCLGIGLVRGISPDKRHLYLAMPLSLHDLRQARVNTLVLGGLQVPLSFNLLASGPYFSFAGGSDAQLHRPRKVRFNIQRKWT